jgi:tryptophanyl-tRNA synthetase
VAEGCRTASIGCIDCKKILIKNVFRMLEPIWAKREELIKNPDMLQEIVDKGNEKARKVCQETMSLVRKAMGFY